MNVKYNESIMAQSGRSMVEVLGTLVLIGVLSIGGLAGYGWSMDKYRSNVLTREILDRAGDVKHQLDLRRKSNNITLGKWDETSLIGYPISKEGSASSEADDGTQTVGIQVMEVKKRVCQMTFDNTIGLMDITVDGERYEKGTVPSSDVCGEMESGNTMVFYVSDKWKYEGQTSGTPGTPDTCTPPRIWDAEKNECVCPNGWVYVDGECKNTCPKGEIAYCSAETSHVSDNPDGSKYPALGAYYYEVFHTTCTEWKCTKAPTILWDPTKDVEDSRKDSRGLEVPLALEGVYSYCALEYNDKCALVTYCNDMPVSWGGNYEYRQRCPSCDISMDLNKYVCVGNEPKRFSQLVDGGDALIHYKKTRIEDEECIPENVCSGQYWGDANYPNCSTSGQCWGPCSTCDGWKTYTDNCGNTYPVADICCGDSSEQGLGCSDVPQGGCAINYPINDRTSCCAVACSDAETGREYCCNNPNDGQACCEHNEGEWDTEGSCCMIDGEPCSMYGQCAQYCINRARR